MLLNTHHKRVEHDFRRTDKLNQLRIDYLHACEGAKDLNATVAQEWKDLAEDIFRQIHEEGFRVYGTLSVLTTADAPATILP